MGIVKFISRLFGGPALEALPVGSPAPTFALKDAAGKSYALADALKKGPVLVAFFKESCPTCQYTFPFLERIHQALAGSNSVQLWGISQSDAADTRAFAREQRVTFPLLLDEEGYPVSNQYGLSFVPTLFLVGPDGGIKLSSVGFSRKDIETVAAEFSQRSGKPVTVFRPGEVVPDYKPG
jgi:peroxiredoxin